MKKQRKSLHAGILSSSLSVCLLALSPVTADALEPPVPSAGICFGLGVTPYFADVIDGVAGTEVIVSNVGEAVLPDDDLDGFNSVRSSLTVKVFSRTGALQWSSPLLRLFSPDVATIFSGGGIVPDTYTLPGLASNTFASALFLGGQACYGTIYAVEASGQKYLAAAIGFLTQTGTDETTPDDQSRVNIWILNRATGAIEFEHRLRAKGGRILAGFLLSGLGDVDSDNDDELVAVWVKALGGGVYQVFYETYNILNGTLEDKFSYFTSNARTFP
jgi:hypothetical protein